MDCHGANFIVIVGTEGCHQDNPRCHQWRQSLHHNNFRVAVYAYVTLIEFTHFYISKCIDLNQIQFDTVLF